jgi:hypothetical protein
MQQQPAITDKSTVLHSIPSLAMTALLATLFLHLDSQPSSAGSATWNLNPTSGDWNTPANWTPATVPNGPSDSGTFDASNTSNISISASTEVNRIVFNPGASAFTFLIDSPLHVDGSIVNQSIRPQTFVVGPPFNTYIEFDGTAKAGRLTTYTALSNPASNVFRAFIFFSLPPVRRVQRSLPMVRQWGERSAAT